MFFDKLEFRMPKLFKLPELGEVGKQRLKRGLLLVVGSSVLMGGMRLLATKGALSLGSVPFSQEQVRDLGAKVVNKAMDVLERESQGDGDLEGQEGEKSEEKGEVAGAAQEEGSEPGGVVEKITEKTVETKVEEIIKTIKSLPEEQANKIKREVMKGICEEICKN